LDGFSIGYPASCDSTPHVTTDGIEILLVISFGGEENQALRYGDYGAEARTFRRKIMLDFNACQSDRECISEKKTATSLGAVTD
jgi:hypothetical protein